MLLLALYQAYLLNLRGILLPMRPSSIPTTEGSGLLPPSPEGWISFIKLLQHENDVSEKRMFVKPAASCGIRRYNLIVKLTAVVELGTLCLKFIEAHYQARWLKRNLSYYGKCSRERCPQLGKLGSVHSMIAKASNYSHALEPPGNKKEV